MFKVSHKSKISYYYTSTLMTHRLEKANFVLDWYRGYYVRFTSRTFPFVYEGRIRERSAVQFRD